LNGRTKFFNSFGSSAKNEALKPVCLIRHPYLKMVSTRESFHPETKVCTMITILQFELQHLRVLSFEAFMGSQN
jgi:hypothetical protein